MAILHILINVFSSSKNVSAVYACVCVCVRGAFFFFFFPFLSLVIEFHSSLICVRVYMMLL